MAINIGYLSFKLDKLNTFLKKFKNPNSVTYQIINDEIKMLTKKINGTNETTENVKNYNSQWRKYYDMALERRNIRLDEQQYNRSINGNVNPKTNKLSKIAKNHSKK